MRNVPLMRVSDPPQSVPFTRPKREIRMPKIRPQRKPEGGSRPLYGIWHATIGGPVRMTGGAFLFVAAMFLGGFSDTYRSWRMAQLCTNRCMFMLM